MFICDWFVMRSAAIFLLVFFTASLSCIRNDIPYPVVPAGIVSVEGKGFTCSPEDIDGGKRVVTIHLDDTTDISKVVISSVGITEKARSSVSFPGVFDMREDLALDVSIYQDYRWKIHAEQNIRREFVVEGQIGVSEIDSENRTAIAKVPMEADLGNVRIISLILGPEGITSIDPEPEDITSFENFRTVDVRYHDFHERWTLVVEKTEIKVEFEYAEAWTRVIWLKATGIPEVESGFRYRKKGETEWNAVSGNSVEQKDGIFSACLYGLEPETEYEVVAYCGEDETDTVGLVTGKEEVLPGAGFEDWYVESGVVYPGKSKEEAFWGTGNPGASIASVTMTDKSTDTRPGSGGKYSAKLESKLAGIAGIGKLAAGNIFSGHYIATRGTNGIVGFGRPFTMRPTALRGWFKYNCGTVTDLGKDTPPSAGMVKGGPDKGIIYIALGNWTPQEYGISVNEPEGKQMLGTDEVPICVDTRDVKSLFNKNAPAVIGYGELILDRTVGEWQEFTINIDYRAYDRIPTHIVVIATASMYGDFYTGSRESVLTIDDFELVYDIVEQ